MIKKLFIILFLSVDLLSFSQQKAKIGMSLEEAKKLFPSAKESRYEKEIVLEVPDTIHGLADGWAYNFEDGTLRSMLFHKYIGELNEANFKKCLKATQEILADYKKWYGKPDEEIRGNQKYVDPYKKKHWGYPVLIAKWKDVKGEKMKVEFKFMGSKGEYQFLVSIIHFNKDYPYYE